MDNVKNSVANNNGDVANNNNDVNNNSGVDNNSVANNNDVDNNKAIEGHMDRLPISQFEGKELDGAIEALLFVTNEPLSTLVIANTLGIDASEAKTRLESISVNLEEGDRGIQLREVADGWRLFTHPRYDSLVEKYVLSWDTRKLSGAAMETLAIIAYTQPVTRSGIATIRGVNSDSVVTSLVDKGLVREVGTADTPGNPILYGTSREFLERFGLRSLKDLTDLDEFAPDEQTKILIERRLGATREDIGLTEDEASRMAEEMLFSENEELEDMAEDAKAALRGALASTLGLVEKVDFDSLEFDLDDE